ncbi:MAG: PASTA domain-containing protein [Paracoccus sp. (in: a-proteobacteria)]|nr:PASTA domain-containing protein [Paracoccus sp. (in: a-proteobacteria)]
MRLYYAAVHYAAILGAGSIALLPLTASAYELSATAPGFAVAQPDAVPANPAGDGQNYACWPRPDGFATQGAQLADDHGWNVLSETVADGLAFVSFAGRVVPSTSGTCVMEDGNIAIFRGQNLLGLIYRDATAAPGEDAPQAIGALQQIQPGVIRILAGDQLALPLADIVLSGTGGAAVHPVSAETTVCGNSVVPNIYGETILDARAALQAAGWQPVRSPDADPPDEFFTTHDIIEAESCSGTGLGYCSFTYQNAGGDTLTVTTGGDMPEYAPVLAFDAGCRRG